MQGLEIIIYTYTIGRQKGEDRDLQEGVGGMEAPKGQRLNDTQKKSPS